MSRAKWLTMQRGTDRMIAACIAQRIVNLPVAITTVAAVNANTGGKLVKRG
jgi:hypothetical protein